MTLKLGNSLSPWITLSCGELQKRARSERKEGDEGKQQPKEDGGINSGGERESNG